MEDKKGNKWAENKRNNDHVSQNFPEHSFALLFHKVRGALKPGNTQRAGGEGEDYSHENTALGEHNLLRLLNVGEVEGLCVEDVDYTEDHKHDQSETMEQEHAQGHIGRVPDAGDDNQCEQE